MWFIVRKSFYFSIHIVRFQSYEFSFTFSFIYDSHFTFSSVAIREMVLVLVFVCDWLIFSFSF